MFFIFIFIFIFFSTGQLLVHVCLAVPPIILHNLSLRAILYDAVLQLDNKFDLI